MQRQAIEKVKKRQAQSSKKQWGEKTDKLTSALSNHGGAQRKQTVDDRCNEQLLLRVRRERRIHQRKAVRHVQREQFRFERNKMAELIKHLSQIERAQYQPICAVVRKNVWRRREYDQWQQMSERTRVKAKKVFESA